MKVFEAKKICKNFYRTHALTDVDFDLEEGEVMALAGENGAGKSTLMKCLLGIHEPTSGEMYLFGKKYEPKSPYDALMQGISMVHQELCLVPSMTVSDNVWIGRVKKFSKNGLYDPELAVAATRKLFDEYGINVDPRATVKTLSTAQMQMVEIGRAISYDPKVIILDEPTSALSESEVEVLYKVIRNMTARKTSIIFISHKLEEVFEVANRVTVFRDGHSISVRNVESLTMDMLINDIAGREVGNIYPKIDVKPGQVELEVKNLSKAGKYKDISCKVHAGEILGFAGLVGAGRTEIMDGIYGIDPVDSGEILLEGKKVVNKTPRHALNNGIAMVTEDRLRRGVNKKMNVKMNMTLAYLYRICKGIFIDMNRENTDAENMAKRLKVKTAGIQMPIWSLSGGNQQKVMVGRALLTDPKVLIMDEPTRGVDVGAKQEIYEYLNELAAQGLAILLISSDLPEVMGMSDRMLVLREGKIVGEHIRNDGTSSDKVMSEMFGLTSSVSEE